MSDNEQQIKDWFARPTNDESGTSPFSATVNTDPTSTGGHSALDLTLTVKKGSK